VRAKNFIMNREAVRYVICTLCPWLKIANMLNPNVLIITRNIIMIRVIKPNYRERVNISAPCGVKVINKMYAEPGDCPVCGRHLQKSETKKAPVMVYTCLTHPEVENVC
jgi:hypothetical protein